MSHHSDLVIRYCMILTCLTLSCHQCLADDTPLENAMRQQIILNGVWQAYASGTNAGTIPTDSWGEARVPHSWGRGEQENFPMPKEAAGNPTLSMWFQRRIHIPATWKDSRRIMVKYLSIHEGHRIYWNGKLVKEEAAARYVETVDVTPLVNYGKDNTLTIQTIFPEKMAARGDFIRDLGITRSIYLVTEAPVSIAYALIQPSVRNSRLKVVYGLRNTTQSTQTLTLKATVLDRQGKEALKLPAQTVTIGPKEERQATLQAPWADPILWGFGNYGQPYLYTLRSELGKDDTRYDRFGFREFRTQGTNFLLNGKQIFLKGDLLSRYTTYFESPQFVTAYYQRLRAGGMNFMRMHGSRFDSHYWYEVADELGFLVEAQATHYSDATGIKEADSPAVKRMWRNVIIENYNHPALIFWSIDNETFSVGLASRQNLAKITPKILREYDNLSTFVRSLDPTRIVEIHHNYMIYPFMKRGRFDRRNFQTFNIHPYGSLETRINAETRGVGFTFEVPVVVGEVFHFPNPRDFVNNPQGALADQWRVGKSFYTQILDASRAKGVSSIILCSLDDAGFVGFNDRRKLELGPWTEQAVTTDAQGNLQKKNNFRTVVTWPSLSGEGTRPKTILGYAFDNGMFGYNVNWFDPKAPMFRPNTVVTQVKKAFAQIPNGDVPNPTHRVPEVIVLLPKSSAGNTVWLAPKGERRNVSAVIADSKGRAWFRLNAPGAYQVEATINGVLEKRDLVIADFPTLQDRPGYDYLTMVEFEPKAGQLLQAELNAPVSFVPQGCELPGELVKNGDFEQWNDTNPTNWINSGKRVAGRATGSMAIQQTGNIVSIAQTLQLLPGKRYRISGWIRKDSGHGTGVIALRKGDWNITLEIPGSDKAGEWKHVEKDYTADGSEVYVYCTNNYMGEQGRCTFDDISIRLLETKQDPDADLPLKQGPFQLSHDGFIRNWLTLGPLPNQEKKDRTFYGHGHDFLNSEPQARPHFKAPIRVTFPADSYWLPATTKTRWTQLHSSGDFINLCVLKNPQLGIAALEPAYVCGYLYAIIDSEQQQDISLGMGSDDGYKLWLNGKQIADHMECRGADKDQETYEVTLNKGENHLLLKVSQISGGWGVYVRLRKPDGGKAQGIRIRLK